MMDAVDLPQGLIRYASEENIEKQKKFRFTPRIKGYAAVLFILVTVLSGMLFLRSDVEANILRLPGQLYEHKDGNIISNVYTFKLINKTSVDYDNVRFEIKSHPGTIHTVKGKSMRIPANGMAEGTLFVEINQAALKNEKDKIVIEVYNGEQLIETTGTTFLGPRSYH